MFQKKFHFPFSFFIFFWIIFFNFSFLLNNNALNMQKTIFIDDFPKNMLFTHIYSRFILPSTNHQSIDYEDIFM